MKYRNLSLIGTSHIAMQSIQSIKANYKELEPDIIALELDKKRLYGLITKRKARLTLKIAWRVGIKGLIFSLIGAWAERKLGELVGVSPGSDMLTAYNLARKDNKKVALIDQDIEITLRKLSKAITWREKWNFAVDIFNAVVLRKKELDGFDLASVPDQKVIANLLIKVRHKYPNIFRILVTERNKIMAKNISALMQMHPEQKILALVGAGHEKEMIEMIRQESPNVYSNTFSVDIG